MKLHIEMPGKIFLLGEYAALHGEPAWVAAVPGRFTLSSPISPAPRSGSATSAAAAFHPDSPAGRHLAGLDFSSDSLSWEDPWKGAGGFGASSAQFGASYFWTQFVRKAPDNALSPDGWRQAWTTYQELQAPEMRGSGADLVAQWLGGVLELGPSESAEPGVRSLTSLADWSCLMVFSATSQDAGRKVRTHEHLRQWRERNNARETVLLGALVREACKIFDAAPSSFALELGRVLTSYAEALRALGLEDSRMTADRLTLSTLPGVRGAKGCGALQSDALVIAFDEAAGPLARAEVVEQAQKRGLGLVTDGLRPERGITWRIGA